MLCYVMLCYVLLCYVMLCYLMLCYAMFCYVMLCQVMLSYVMLCYVVSQFHDLEKMTIFFENFKAQITFLFYFFLHWESNLFRPGMHSLPP